MNFISAVSSEYVIQLHLCKGLQNSDFGVFKVDKHYVLSKEVITLCLSSYRRAAAIKLYLQFYIFFFQAYG